MRVTQVAGLSLLLTTALASGGCAIVINTPSLRYDSPEAQGKGKGYVGTALGQTRDVTLVSNTTTNPPATTAGQAPGVAWPIYTGLGVLDRMDVELRLPLINMLDVSAYLLRAKYQWVGATRAEGATSGFNLATTLGIGGTTGNRTDSDSLTSVSAVISGSLWAADAGVVAGYRVSPWFMPYGSLAASFYGLSGTIARTSGGTTVTNAISGNIQQASLNLGAQFDIKMFFAKLESSLSYTVAGSLAVVAPAAGVAIGLQW